MQLKRPLDYLRYLLFSSLFLSGHVNSATAAVLHHPTQTEVLAYLDDYQPQVINAEQTLSFSDFITRLQDKRVIFVGEQHDRYDHHLNQLAILQALYQQNPNLAIGLEWFQKPFQPVLDDYLAGNITESELLHRSGYYERWRYDYRLLRPIINFAKAKQIPLLALNAAQEVTAKVSKQGLAGLSADERAQIPATIHPPDDEYRRYLQAVYEQHMRGHSDSDAGNFIMVQRIWDETMAAGVVDYLRHHPKQRMVVFAGSGHLRAAAIPNDVARHLPPEQLSTVHSVEQHQTGSEAAASFDYLVMTEEKKLPPTGKLGVWLDDQPGRVMVRKLAKNSAAGQAGLQKGDRIVSVNTETIRSMAQLLRLLSHTRPGDEVSVQVDREGEQLKYVFLLQ